MLMLLKQSKIILLLIILLLTQGLAIAEIEKKHQSVFRIITGKPLVSANSSQQLLEVIEETINTLAVKLGLSLAPIESQNLIKNGYLNLSDKGTLFIHKNTIYILTSTGSGFLINDDHYIITNHHVIDSVISGEGNAFVLENKNDEVSIHHLSIANYSERADLAILKSDSSIDAPPIELAINTEVGNRVDAIGFPAGADMLIDQFTAEPTLTSGVISAHREALQWSNGNVLEAVQHDADINRGNSGGALLDECGYLVGVNVGAPLGERLDQTGIYYAVHNNELISLLNSSQPIAYTQATCSGNDTISTNIYYLFATLMLFLLTIGYALKRHVNALAQRIERGESPMPKSKIISNLVSSKLHSMRNESRQNNKEKWKLDDHGRYYYFDTQGDGLVYWEGEGNPNELQPPASHPQVDAINSITLISSTGQAAITLIQNVPLYLGRKPQKDAEYIINSPHVSACHAVLQYDGQSVWVEDKNSTNGTYIEGHKLIEKTALRLNQTLMFAQQQFSFQLQGSSSPMPNPTSTVVGYMVLLTDPEIYLKLEIGCQYTIGRAIDCDLILDQNYISGHHCLLSVSQQGVVEAVDNHSSNGVFYQEPGNRVSSIKLMEGDLLLIADSRYALQLVKQLSNDIN